MIKIGLIGSCQLVTCYDFFLNDDVKQQNNINIEFALPFYIYDINYIYYKCKLDYKIFNEIDILIIENNKLNCEASSQKIIQYCIKNHKNIKIIKTCLIKFPIFPINWSGHGENKKDYENWKDLDKIDYKQKFNYLISKLKNDFTYTNLDVNIVKFIEDNFNKKLLFTHSLHPTNILLYELWKSIFKNLNIDITNYNYNYTSELILFWNNPFTSKMIIDLNIQFQIDVDDNFYIKRYNQNKDNIKLGNVIVENNVQ